MNENQIELSPRSKRNLRARERYAANREKILERQREYRKVNREKILEREREYRKRKADEKEWQEILKQLDPEGKYKVPHALIYKK